jgi:hypothetical protein
METVGVLLLLTTAINKLYVIDCVVDKAFAGVTITGLKIRSKQNLHFTYTES